MKKHKRNSPLAVSMGLSGAVAKGLISYNEMIEAMNNYFKASILLRKRKRKTSPKLPLTAVKC
jgi:hypothetical protein